METLLCLIVMAIMAVVHFREEIFIKMGLEGREPTFMALLQIVASWTVAMVIAVPFALYCVCQNNPRETFNSIVRKFWD